MIAAKLGAAAMMAAAGLYAAAAIGAQPAAAHAGPIQWCNPSSPLYDATVCYNDSGPHSGYGCDPYSDAFNANYCAAQRGW